jgi:serine/threonine protein kinase
MVYRHDVNDHLHYTIVGNHHYQSPECLSQEGYDRSEDWWAVAVLCFHLLAGITPFEAKHGCTEAEERENIVLAKILWDNLPMGGTRLSPECRDFITRMLRESKVERLSYQSTGAVREHAFFEGISFESLWKGRGPIKLELSGSGSNYIHQELEDDMAMALPALWRENNDSLLPSDAAQRRKDELSRFKTINNF